MRLNSRQNEARHLHHKKEEKACLYRLFYSETALVQSAFYLNSSQLYLTLNRPLYRIHQRQLAIMSTYLSAESIKKIEAIIGYEFNDKTLLEKSLQSAGFGPHREGNKPLALIGDAALRLVLYLGGYETDSSIRKSSSIPYTYRRLGFVDKRNR